MFRNTANRVFILAVCIIPSILILWDKWEAKSFWELIIEFVTKSLGLVFAIFLPCYLTMILAGNLSSKLGKGNKWLLTLLYIPVTFFVYVAVYELMYVRLHPELGSSTSALVLILPVFYGLPALAVIYFLMYFLITRKKKNIS